MLGLAISVFGSVAWAVDSIVDRRPGPRGSQPVLRHWLVELPREHQKVWFGTGESLLTAESLGSLDVQAEILLEAKSIIWIYGYADLDELSVELEVSKLARRRAEAVRDYLIDKGVAGNLIRIAAFVFPPPKNPPFGAGVVRPARYAVTYPLRVKP